MPNDKIVKIHSYLKSQGVTVPVKVKDFEAELNPERIQKLHTYLIEKDVLVPENISDFTKTLDLESNPWDKDEIIVPVTKKGQPIESSSTPAQSPLPYSWLAENKTYISWGASLVSVVFLIFLFYKIRNKWIPYFLKFNFKRIGIGVGIVIGAIASVLAFTNPSLNQFNEFAPTAYNEFYIRDKENVDTARLHNYILFSYYVCIFEDYDGIRKEVYLGIFNNFYPYGYLEGEKLFRR